MLGTDVTLKGKIAQQSTLRVQVRMWDKKGFGKNLRVYTVHTYCKFDKGESSLCDTVQDIKVVSWQYCILMFKIKTCWKNLGSHYIVWKVQLCDTPDVKSPTLAKDVFHHGRVKILFLCSFTFDRTYSQRLQPLNYSETFGLNKINHFNY